MKIDRELTMKIARRLLAVIGILVLIPVVAIGTLAVSARNSDGPSGVFAGGPLVAGELVTGAEPDWSNTRGVPGLVEVQLLDPPRSRLMGMAEHEGRIYVVSGYMGSTIGRLWKRWPLEAERDGRAVIRVGGKRYQRTAVRITTGARLEGITAALRRNGSGATRANVEAGEMWLFELAPPSSDMTGAPR